jgi:hypothetical protein
VGDGTAVSIGFPKDTTAQTREAKCWLAAFSGRRVGKKSGRRKRRSLPYGFRALRIRSTPSGSVKSTVDEDESYPCTKSVDSRL